MEIYNILAEGTKWEDTTREVSFELRRNRRGSDVDRVSLGRETSPRLSNTYNRLKYIQNPYTVLTSLNSGRRSLSYSMHFSYRFRNNKGQSGRIFVASGRSKRAPTWKDNRYDSTVEGIINERGNNQYCINNEPTMNSIWSLLLMCSYGRHPERTSYIHIPYE